MENVKICVTCRQGLGLAWFLAGNAMCKLCVTQSVIRQYERGARTVKNGILVSRARSREGDLQALRDAGADSPRSNKSGAIHAAASAAQSGEKSPNGESAEKQK